MSIVSISMVRNEADIIEVFVRYHIQFLDRMYIIDHDSDDHTKIILEKLKKEGLPIHICNFSGFAQQQSELITECMREIAKRPEIKWIIPLDADEFIFSKKGSVCDAIDVLGGSHVYRLPWYNFVPTTDDDFSEMNVLKRIQHRLSDPHSYLTKLIVSSKIASSEDISISQGNHNIIKNSDKHYPVDIGHDLAIAHFPVRSINQLTRKILLSWPRNIARGVNNDAWHWQELFGRLKTGESLSQEELCRIAKQYSVAEARASTVNTVVDTLEAPSLQYTSFIDSKYFGVNQAVILSNTLDAMEKIAHELAQAKESAQTDKNKGELHCNQCDRLKADIEHMHNSKSWRFTSWFRLAEASIRRTKKHTLSSVLSDSAKAAKKEKKEPSSDVVEYIWYKPFFTTCPRKDRSVRVIIPTNGQNWSMLGRCLESVRNTSYCVQISTTIVVCPEDECSRADVERLANEYNAQVIYLTGPFNFSYSINQGLQQRGDEQFVLFLNDDCILQTSGMISRMIDMMADRRVACIGPWLNQKNEDGVVLGSPRREGFTYLCSPIPATCVLWDSEWLDRVGPLDEAFSKYGLEEADLSFRALRRGAFWGRLDDVEVLHENHASFGHEQAHFKSPLHQHNMLVWSRKYPYIHSWGGGKEWLPLPGIQVVLWTTDDVNPVGLMDNLSSALDGFHWIVTWSDNLEVDVPIDLSSGKADWWGTRKCPKNASTSVVKNAGLDVNEHFFNMYPVICFLNASSSLDPERIRWLLPKMKEQQCAIAWGDYAVKNGEGELIYKSSRKLKLSDIPLEATLIHRSLVKSGRLFSETANNNEDKLLWKRLSMNGNRSLAFPGKNVATITNNAISSIIEDKESLYSELVGIR
ncbi:glycosyltransferase family 2 protein [Patescibacteria group bacterium]|nr:glycosyltransferase family 2 protein [Patescibacteria group bacterium]